MYVKSTTYSNSPEFLASAHYINFTGTVSDEGVVADTEGKKIVKAGTPLDADGKVFTATLGQVATGLLFSDVDVTYGSQPGAYMVEGYVLSERLPVAIPDEFKTAMKKITFR